jgi:uncharacterized protein YkwD
LAKKEREEQDKPRRRLAGWWTLATASACLALAATAFGFVVTGPVTVGAETGVVAEPTASPTASPADSSNEPEPVPAITAPSPSPSAGSDTEVFDAPQIKIEPPPPPPTSGKKGTGSPTDPSGAYLPYDVYCLNPATPYQTSASGPLAFLTLINLERRRIGLSDLIWSSSLASTALTWSQTMAANDDAVPGNPGAALAHGMVPSPGGQNVATNWVTDGGGNIIFDGFSLSGSLNYAHKGLMYSYGHCVNILRPSFTTMGAGGLQSGEGVWYWTENFGY